MVQNMTRADDIQFNSFLASAPLTGQKKGVLFKGAYLPQKSDVLPPYLDTIQALSSTRVFLHTQRKSWLLCMGRTSTANKPLPLNYSPKQLSVSWESNPAHVEASKNFNIYSKYSKYSSLIRMNVTQY
jgi:hypothetical protein